MQTATVNNGCYAVQNFFRFYPNTEKPHIFALAVIELEKSHCPKLVLS